MSFFRGRRLRQNEAIRELVRETTLLPKDLVMPFFVIPGAGICEPIESMPGQYRFSVDLCVAQAREASRLGIRAVLLFGIPAQKDSAGTEASSMQGAVQRCCSEIRNQVPELCVITDVCMCEYTNHGHCGILNKSGEVDNDATLNHLAEIALSHANAGAHLIAPSDMMDGRIGFIRRALDTQGFISTGIMSYAAKYSSSFYGPFREAAGSTPQYGNRRGYQMDSANGREALREVTADLTEGADIIMVKPALAYLDVIQRVRQICTVPLAAYNVSGEYTMVKLASEKGLADEKSMVSEILTGIRRAGADIIISYHALDMARWMQKELSSDRT